jgi:hypothetical protein
MYVSPFGRIQPQLNSDSTFQLWLNSDSAIQLWLNSSVRIFVRYPAGATDVNLSRVKILIYTDLKRYDVMIEILLFYGTVLEMRP